MHNTRKISDALYYVGGSDRRLALFENAFPIPRGVSYNSYLLLDERTALIDTVDISVSESFFENVAHVLKTSGKTLDYVVVNHMEPDHCATLSDLIMRYPGVKVVCNIKTVALIKQFFDFDIDSRVVIVNEGDKLSLGAHELTFIMTPMVHWPEVMMTYDAADKTLFSADAFGTFGALSGNIFADEVEFERDFMSDARRYYANIVGKYGAQVKTALGKAATVDIAMLCPLHGPIWRTDIHKFIEKYQKWSDYEPEESAVVIAYGSIYGHTANTADILASMLADRGVKNIAMYDVSATHASQIVSEAFRASHLVFASATYNAGIFTNMENVLNDLKAHNLQNRTFAFIENGSWGPVAKAQMLKLAQSMKNITVLENSLTVRSALKENQLDELQALADAIVASMNNEAATVSSAAVERGAMFKLSYGLFVLTARDGEKDNGCIINTVTQVTEKPQRITIAVNKNNFTHDMIIKTGSFNVSILSTDAPFKVFKHFGFQSGRNVNKFEGCENTVRTDNGIVYIPRYTNAVISGKVISTIDQGTHTLFIAQVTEAKVLSTVPSMTYQYYFDNVKPKPAAEAAPKKKGFVCTICGYVYEGDTLPADFICPLCKHGAEFFEPIK